MMVLEEKLFLLGTPIFFKFHRNLFHICQDISLWVINESLHCGTRGNVKGSPNSVGFILWAHECLNKIT